MAGVNKVIILGNLGRDPETRYSSGGDAMCTVSVATSESWKDKTSGDKQERTEWHRIVFFKRLAEVVAQYLRKGSKIYVEGKLQTRKWQNKDGKDQYTTEIVAHTMQMLGGGQDAGKQTAEPPHDTGADEYRKASGSSGTNKETKPAPQNDFDDDIPFVFIIGMPFVMMLLSANGLTKTVLEVLT